MLVPAIFTCSSASGGGERAALLAKSAKRSLGIYSPSTDKASRNRIEGSTPGAVSKRRIIATLDDDEDLWLDEDRVVGESRYKVFELTSVYTGRGSLPVSVNQNNRQPILAN